MRKKGLFIFPLLLFTSAATAASCDHATTEVSRPGTPATCTESGWTDEVTCTKCQQVIASRAPIAPLGHDYDHSYDYSIGGKGDVCMRCHQVSPFTKIARIYFSDDRRHVFINAHHGLVSEELRIPENSLASISYAIEKGVEICEIDPKMTRDGEIVLSHDASIASRQLYNFTPTHDADNYVVGSGATANWYDELEEAELRVSDNINEGSGEKVARLEEVLDLCKDKCLVSLDCDWWAVDANKVVKMIRDRHMEKQCVLRDSLFTAGGKPMPDGLWFQVNDQRPGAWGSSLDRDEPEGQNDSSSHPNPDRFGWERKMNVTGATSFLTDEPLELMDYLKSIGRRGWEDWEMEPEDQRARPTMRIPAMELKRFVKGQPIKYGIQETDDWRVISDGPEGGDPERNEYFFELELKDPGKRWANGDFINTSNLRKKFWYYAEIYPTCEGGDIAEVDGVWIVTPNVGATEVTVTGLPEGAKLAVKCGDYAVPSAAFAGFGEGKTEGVFSLALNPEGVVTIGDKEIRVAPTVGALDDSEPFTVGEGSVAVTVKAIPGLKYALKRTDSLRPVEDNGPYQEWGEVGDPVVATGVTVTLEDAEPPADKAFYTIVVSMP